MLKWQYINQNREACFCEYAIGFINGGKVLVVKQTAHSKTAIMNMMEEITSGLLAGPLRATDATQLRVFTFCPSEKPSEPQWQEVSFETIVRRPTEQGLVQATINSLFPVKQPYVVSEAQWGSVSSAIQVQLENIDPDRLAR